MWLASTATFWGSLGLVGYTYAGYPLTMAALSRWRPKRVVSGPAQPTVSIVIAARDESTWLGDKLDVLLSLRYAPGRVEIIVVDDGSRDDTATIAEGFRERGVTTLRLPEPRGKWAAINAGVAITRHDIVVFSDVRQRLAPDALEALIRPFADPTVGTVTGALELDTSEAAGLYWRYERFIRACESRVDSIVGATGAWYAIRRELFRPLPPDCLLDDVYTPMQIALQGYRTVLAVDATVFDKEPPLEREFARKVRTLAGNYQLLAQLPELLNPRRNRLLPQLVSHKLMRLACPWALGTMFASNCVLVVTFAPGWPLYVITLAGQVGLYSLALNARLRPGRAGRLSRLADTFVTLNLAAVEGLRRYLRDDVRWDTP